MALYYYKLTIRIKIKGVDAREFTIFNYFCGYRFVVHNIGTSHLISELILSINTSHDLELSLFKFSHIHSSLLQLENVY